MDFDPARVVKPQPVPDDLLCIICTGLLVDPVEGPCEHLACRQCLNTWLLKLGKRTCPECRHPLDSKRIKQAHRTIRNRVNALEVTCANAGRGCSEIMTVGMLQQHLELCGKSLERCGNVDCQEVVPREELASHLEKCSHRDILCRRCNCNIKFRDQEKHTRNDCGGVDVACQLNGGCGAIMRRDMLAAHVASDCSKGMVACGIPGCQVQVARGDMARHLESSLAQHVLSLSCALQGAVSEISALKEELRQLKVVFSEGPASKKARISTAEDIAGISCVTTLTGHTLPMTALAMGDRVLYSASDDKSTRVWSLPGMTSTVAVDHHAVQAMAVADGVLYMGSPREITTWSTTDHKRGPSVIGLLGVVRALAVGGGHIYCGITGGAIQVWSTTGSLDHVCNMTGHRTTASALLLGDKVLFSGSYDHSIKVWSTASHRCVATMEGHFHRITSLAMGEGMLFSASRDSTIRVWSTTSYMCLSEICEDSYGLALAVGNGFLCAAMADKVVKVWSTQDYSKAKTISETGDDARALLAHNGLLYAGLANATIKVWLLPQ